MFCPGKVGLAVTQHVRSQRLKSASSERDKMFILDSSDLSLCGPESNAVLDLFDYHDP